MLLKVRWSCRWLVYAGWIVLVSEYRVGLWIPNGCLLSDMEQVGISGAGEHTFGGAFLLAL
jgi:hypothetical protein